MRIIAPAQSALRLAQQQNLPELVCRLFILLGVHTTALVDVPFQHLQQMTSGLVSLEGSSDKDACCRRMSLLSQHHGICQAEQQFHP